MSGREIDIAVVGATGLVGEAVLTLLAARDFPAGNVFALASEASLGKTLSFGSRQLTVGVLNDFDFSQVELAIFAVGAEVARTEVPKAVEADCTVIDCSDAFRLEEGVPLVIPEVNPYQIGDYEQRGIIASPAAATTQMLLALKPFFDFGGVERISVFTYQAVSNQGRAAVAGLAGETARLMNGKSVEPGQFLQQMAFNLLPQIGVMGENGRCSEEEALDWESQKIIVDQPPRVNPAVVQVPVFFGNAMMINFEPREWINITQARELLEQAPEVRLVENWQSGVYPSQIGKPEEDITLSVGRLWQDPSSDQGLNIWVVADNVRRGGALNAVQIAELLVKEYL
ncbi:MAG: aspartate-semialdehyde dehydrogenase [Gammaproteobacteria bacterium]|nr:aspartate-semialdehyde dehydrogenase [Gammaproteobacteria bacterium]